MTKHCFNSLVILGENQKMQLILPFLVVQLVGFLMLQLLIYKQIIVMQMSATKDNVIYCVY